MLKILVIGYKRRFNVVSGALNLVSEENNLEMQVDKVFVDLDYNKNIDLILEETNLRKKVYDFIFIDPSFVSLENDKIKRDHMIKDMPSILNKSCDTKFSDLCIKTKTDLNNHTKNLKLNTCYNDFLKKILLNSAFKFYSEETVFIFNSKTNSDNCDINYSLSDKLGIKNKAYCILGNILPENLKRALDTRSVFFDKLEVA